LKLPLKLEISSLILLDQQLLVRILVHHAEMHPLKNLVQEWLHGQRLIPELANELIDKVQDRRLTNPEYKQSGYSTILETMRPGAADDAFGLQSSGYDAVKQDDGTFAAPKYVEVGGKPALFKEEGEITPMTNDEIIAERKLGKKSSGRASAKGLAQVRKAENETAAALPPSVTKIPTSMQR
jgi:hypothetical protein